MKRLFLYLLLSVTAFWGLSAGATILFGALGSLWLSMAYILVLILLPALAFGISYSLVLTWNIRSIAGVAATILVFWHLLSFFGGMLVNLPFLADFWAGFIVGATKTTAIWGILAAARENWKSDT